MKFESFKKIIVVLDFCLPSNSMLVDGKDLDFDLDEKMIFIFQK